MRTFGALPVQSLVIAAIDREDTERDEEAADRKAHEKHLERLAHEHHQPDVHELAPIERRRLGVRLALESPHLARQARDQEARPQEDEQAGQDRQRGRLDRREHLPDLVRQEEDDREDHQQGHRAREQLERGAKLADEPPQRPAQDRDESEPHHGVDQAEEDQVAARGDEGAAPLPAEDERQDRRDDHEQGELRLADVLRDRPWPGARGPG